MVAEQSVIGACLQDNEAYWRVSLSQADFSDAFFGECWSEIERSANLGEPFDAITLSETGLDLEGLMNCVTNTPGASNVKHYARVVREKSISRQATKILSQAMSGLAAGDLTAITELQASLEALNRSEGESVDFGSVLRAGLDQVEAAQERSAKGGLVGAPTGIRWLDQRTGGLYGSKLVIVAARPSLGKTALAMQLAQAAASAGYPVGIASLEMSCAELAIRSFAHQYQINGTALGMGDTETVQQLTGQVANDEAKKDKLMTLPIYVDDATYTLDGITSRITEWHRKHGIKLAVVDHLQLVECRRGNNRNESVGHITRQLKVLAKRLDIPVVLVSQFSRNNERDNRPPKLSDLRDSGNIEQDADIVLALHADLMETLTDGCREVSLILLKNRGGIVGARKDLLFHGPSQTFREKAFSYGYA